MATQSNKEVFLGGLRKLLEEEWQADLLLKGGDSDEGSAISAHKLILAGRSVVFKKLLESDEFKALSKVETVTLSEMKHTEVEALVEIMYSADGSISSESLRKHARSLYLAADKYEIPHLRDLCRKQLISSLNSSNALNTLELAQIPFDRALHDAAFTTVVANIRTIISSAQFKLFIVNHSNLFVDIMRASITWSNNPNLTPGGSNRYCRNCGSFCCICG